MTEASTTTPTAENTSQVAESHGVLGEALTAAPAATQQAAAPAADAQPAAADGADGDKPIEYTFKLPEGISLGEAEAKAKAFAAKHKLPADEAQALIDLAGEVATSHAKNASEKQLADVRAEVGRWIESAKSDPEIGGDKLTQTLATANAAMTKLGTPQLAQLLKATGLGNHPEVIRVFAKAGQLIAEDKILGSRADPAPEKRSAAEVLFGATT